jgi:periplasmic divalent cation tolerance protein
MKALVVFSTVGAGFDAAPLARSLVEARLAACVNILPGVRSIYRWQEEIEDAAEQLLIIKTTGERVDALREALFAGHPYEVPEFVVVDADQLSDAYREWLFAAVSNFPR